MSQRCNSFQLFNLEKLLNTCDILSYDHDHYHDHDGTPSFWGNQSFWYSNVLTIELSIPGLNIWVDVLKENWIWIFSLHICTEILQDHNEERDQIASKNWNFTKK